MKFAKVLLGAAAGGCMAVGLLALPAAAATTDSDHAPLVHVGLNPATCKTVPGTDSGSVNVHINNQQKASSVNVSVHGALPNTTYEVDARCVRKIGTLTTNSQGTGTANLKNLPWASGPVYIDISVANGGAGAGGYGDTYIAGPFS